LRRYIEVTAAAAGGGAACLAAAGAEELRPCQGLPLTHPLCSQIEAAAAAGSEGMGDGDAPVAPVPDAPGCEGKYGRWGKCSCGPGAVEKRTFAVTREAVTVGRCRLTL
jgi:hypothetical protein